MHCHRHVCGLQRDSQRRGHGVCMPASLGDTRLRGHLDEGCRVLSRCMHAVSTWTGGVNQKPGRTSRQTQVEIGRIAPMNLGGHVQNRRRRTQLNQGEKRPDSRRSNHWWAEDEAGRRMNAHGREAGNWAPPRERYAYDAVYVKINKSKRVVQVVWNAVQSRASEGVVRCNTVSGMLVP